jgi:putative FmdB family regulatory protein
MPTYEYECTSCGQHIEVFQRIVEDPLTTCGACGGPLRKVFHPAGILFKGSGFYATDSRSGAKGAGRKDGETSGAGSTGAAKESTGGSGAGSSTKPATESTGS